MKRFVLALLVVALPVVAAAEAFDREMLLTSDGALYTIESVRSEDTNLTTSASIVLLLTVQKGEEQRSLYVPASLNPGVHLSPSLAFDPTSKALFIFWQNMPTLMSSQLLFCSYENGRFSETTSIDNAPFRFRFNLRIGVTRQILDLKSADQAETLEPRLLVHAVWWDQTGYGESAGYAMLAIREGRVTSIHRHDLLDYITDTDTIPSVVDDDFDRDLFRHAAIFERPGNSSVEIVFGNWDLNRFHRVVLNPVSADGVLRVPIGKQGPDIPAPRRFRREAAADISMLRGSGTDDSLVIYSRTPNALRYQMYRDGAWLEAVTVSLNERVTAEASLEALRRLAAE
ncbi:MAG TPA: hypothetical protein VMT00_16715 [Thermoanaerobaculia bacterium]|nr:hypothetical protein [Thermoanaerobaculia bacterium]